LGISSETRLILVGFDRIFNIALIHSLVIGTLSGNHKHNIMFLHLNWQLEWLLKYYDVVCLLNWVFDHSPPTVFTLSTIASGDLVGTTDYLVAMILEQFLHFLKLIEHRRVMGLVKNSNQAFWCSVVATFLVRAGYSSRPNSCTKMTLLKKLI